MPRIEDNTRNHKVPQPPEVFDCINLIKDSKLGQLIVKSFHKITKYILSVDYKCKSWKIKIQSRTFYYCFFVASSLSWFVKVLFMVWLIPDLNFSYESICALLYGVIPFSIFELYFCPKYLRSLFFNVFPGFIVYSSLSSNLPLLP